MQEGEEEALIAERTLQVNAEKISQLLVTACDALEQVEVSRQAGALELLSQAVGALAALEKLDPAFEGHRKTAESLQYQVEDLRREMAGFMDRVEFDQRRLAEVQRSAPQRVGGQQQAHGDADVDHRGVGEQRADQLDEACDP